MTSRDFCFWLQGFFELRGDESSPVTPAQAECIKRHLVLVFAHEIDPSAGGPAEQKKLDAIHNTQADQVKDSPLKPHAYQGPPLMRC